MSLARVAFDSSLPIVVACSDLPCGNERYTRGDSFPWRDLGITVDDLAHLWIALKVDCVPLPVAKPSTKQPRAARR